MSELSVMLSSLGGASQAADSGQGFAAMVAASGDAAVTGEVSETGPALPGQVGEGGETIEADQLLRLLKGGAASKTAGQAPPAIMDIKVSVAGQETHLALDKAPSDAAAALAAQDAAETAAGHQQANGGGKTAALGAALSQAADDAARSQRTREGATGDLSGSKSDAGAAPRAGTIAETWGGGGSEGPADQGISGRDGGRSAADGRGSSGAGSQQQGTGAFLSALTGTPSHGAGAVRPALDGNTGFDPVSDQIAAEVRAELRAGGLGETSSDGVVKVLHLELKPANLGSVTVRLTLKDNAITIHLEAQRQETLAVIERERQALAGALSSAGYSVDGITAAPQGEMSRHMASLSGSTDSNASAAQGAPWGQDSQGQGLANSSGGQGRPGHAGTGNSAYHHPSDNKDANVNGVRRDADGLYV